MTTVSFCTFCYSGDVHRLQSPGQLKKQVESNDYSFNRVIVVYQECSPNDCNPMINEIKYTPIIIDNVDQVLHDYGIDPNRPQYQSPTDKHHNWKHHVVNHIVGIQWTDADYIVFADSDCWMVSQPDSWVIKGIDILKQNPDVFIVSPNDGEPERKTQTMSQQMFLVRVDDFRQADLNQPGYSGNPQDYPEMPEYHAMLEGRMSHYCRSVGRYRYVLPAEYRYVHHNKLNEDGTYYTDYKEWGIL